MRKVVVLMILITFILSNSCGNKELEDEEFYLYYWEIYKYKHTETEKVKQAFIKTVDKSK